MRSMRSMRGGFIFRNRGPSLKVHHCQHLASVTKHDTGVIGGLQSSRSRAFESSLRVSLSLGANNTDSNAMMIHLTQ